MWKFLGLDPSTKHYDKFVDDLPSLEGKTVAITGTTSGTGYWTAVAAIKKNASAVFLVNRASNRATSTFDKLTKLGEESESKTEVIKIDCDLSDFENVKAGAEALNEAAQKFGGLNIIGNNAGVMAFPDDRTKDGYDIQMQVNHLGHFLLTKLVLPSIVAKFKAGEECRIVQHSSGARLLKSNGLEQKFFVKSDKDKLGGNGFTACFMRYHETKLANSCFAMALAKKLEKHEVFDTSLFKSVVAEPGVAMTALGTNLFASHKTKGMMHYSKMRVLGSMFYLQMMAKKLQSEEDGALCLMQAMFGEDVDNGDFFVPTEKRVGLPFKEIAKTEVVENARDKEDATLSEKNQQLVWEVSEQELGPFFEFA